jgi:hypothetical protein
MEGRDLRGYMKDERRKYGGRSEGSRREVGGRSEEFQLNWHSNGMQNPECGVMEFGIQIVFK